MCKYVAYFMLIKVITFLTSIMSTFFVHDLYNLPMSTFLLFMIYNLSIHVYRCQENRRGIRQMFFPNQKHYFHSSKNSKYKCTYTFRCVVCTLTNFHQCTFSYLVSAKETNTWIKMGQHFVVLGQDFVLLCSIQFF